MMSYASSTGSVPVMTLIGSKYPFMEKAAWAWRHFHAAAIDERVGRLLLESSLLSYRTALEAGLHKNLSEGVIPGMLTRYDTPQLMQAIFPRPIYLINPSNAMGQELRAARSSRKRSQQLLRPTRPWATLIESSSCIEVLVIGFRRISAQLPSHISSSSRTFVNASIANSRSSRLCAAETCTRTRAFP